MMRFFILSLSLFLLFPQAAHAALVGWWKLDEASWNGTANEVVDSAGANHGTSSGGATTKVGKIDRAGSFDGTDDDLALPFPAVSSTGDFTLSVWVYPDNWTGSYTALFDASGRPFSLFFDTNGNISYDGGIFLFTGGMTAGMTNDKWWHLVAMRDSGMPKVFVNTVRLSGGASNSNSVLASTVHVGTNPSAGGTGFQGKIDDVRIYNHALTANEVAELYYSGANTRIR